jgi:hypothetical protein
VAGACSTNGGEEERLMVGKPEGDHCEDQDAGG